MWFGLLCVTATYFTSVGVKAFMAFGASGPEDSPSGSWCMISFGDRPKDLPSGSWNMLGSDDGPMVLPSGSCSIWGSGNGPIPGVACRPSLVVNPLVQAFGKSLSIISKSSKTFLDSMTSSFSLWITSSCVRAVRPWYLILTGAEPRHCHPRPPHFIPETRVSSS